MTKFSEKNHPDIGHSRLLKENLLYSGSWTEMVEFKYEDEEKTVRKWEALHRKKQTPAVIIIAKLKPSNRYILIRQFRPPTKSYIIEFPAGLVDSGEACKCEAKREQLDDLNHKRSALCLFFCSGPLVKMKLNPKCSFR